MRWARFGITIEPFGKDHATAGGSFDTGKEIVRKVYHRDPPHPVVYEWISLKGRGAMHSSKGVVVTINEMLEIVPPDILRYLIARSKPEKANRLRSGDGAHLPDRRVRPGQPRGNQPGVPVLRGSRRYPPASPSGTW